MNPKQWGSAVTSDRRQSLSKVKRIVVKIGSSLLTDWKNKRIQSRFLANLALQVKELHNQGMECVIVTSGAIAAGMFALGFAKRPKAMPQLQALAAIGQSSLMHAYETSFARFGLKVAQILLTREDLSNRARYSNAYHTFLELFKHGVIPVVNENDTVAVEEIKFGDNDTLGVLVCHLCQADLLILLTDREGFYSEDPAVNPKAELIPEVHQLDDHTVKSASHSKTQVGTGGMQTKIQAARSMMQSGLPMVIAHGETPLVLTRILKAEKIGTFFHPAADKMGSRKRWLAWSVKSKGEIQVDGGAERALRENNKSLLPSGIKSVHGHWDKGDIVKITGVDGREIAKGICNYSSSELDLIKGLKSSEVAQKLGPESVEEIVHRDNMVKIDGES